MQLDATCNISVSLTRPVPLPRVAAERAVLYPGPYVLSHVESNAFQIRNKKFFGQMIQF